jgi:CDP-glucose 4,6-dehydratase
MENPLGQRLRELPGPLLLTGHTGFKGTWMTFLLEYLNVPVVGYSLPPDPGSMFERAARTSAIPEVFADIRNYESLEMFIDSHKPSTIIHMAAQPLVLKSYENPRETFEVNVLGTVNLLDIAFKRDFVQAIVVVTTDKVYRNDNTGHSFVETDPLEGKDPYSASKVGTEAVVAAWQQISKVAGGPKIISVRAGNVIGGGDLCLDRLLPDLVRGKVTGSKVSVRNPNSVRPWQHVFDPIRGYIDALEFLLQAHKTITSVNFGPNQKGISVKEICDFVVRRWDLNIEISKDMNSPDNREAKQLNLDSSFAREILGWSSELSQEEALRATMEWWETVLTLKNSPSNTTKLQIQNFMKDRK